MDSPSTSYECAGQPTFQIVDEDSIPPLPLSPPPPSPSPPSLPPSSPQISDREYESRPSKKQKKNHNDVRADEALINMRAKEHEKHMENLHLKNKILKQKLKNLEAEYEIIDMKRAVLALQGKELLQKST